MPISPAVVDVEGNLDPDQGMQEILMKTGEADMELEMTGQDLGQVQRLEKDFREQYIDVSTSVSKLHTPHNGLNTLFIIRYKVIPVLGVFGIDLLTPK